jgi:hypothetical protein
MTSFRFQTLTEISDGLDQRASAFALALQATRPPTRLLSTIDQYSSYVFGIVKWGIGESLGDRSPTGRQRLSTWLSVKNRP